MLDLSTVSEVQPLTKKLIRSVVTDEEIYRYYLGPKFKLGSSFTSPFRKDKHPSLTIFRSSYSDYVLWKDMSTGDYGNVFEFVSRLYHIGFKETLAKINADLALGLHANTPTPSAERVRQDARRHPVKLKHLGIKRRPFTPNDLSYWNSYGISKDLLVFYNVFAVLWVSYQGARIWSHYKDALCFAYLFYKDGRYMYKIYKPLIKDRTKKWISNTDASVLQGWDQLPKKGKRLVITKSLKDVMVLRTLGIASVAMQSETSIIKESVMNELKERFEFIYILQDFDYAGVKGSNRFRKTYPYVIPFFVQDWKTRHNGLKDISDFRKSTDKERTLYHLENCLSKWQELLLREEKKVTT